MTDLSLPTARQRYEAAQKSVRAAWAVGEDDSGRREFPEPHHPYRTCFQRDRDRIVHSSAFRRLDFKTQVFVPHEHDHFRTRLTHTLEVAQIGRDLGRALGLNEDLIEAVALAHDLGHPPFGHGGEQVLDELMAEHGGFEHNRQSLRIVDYLEHPYPDFRGLNLTLVVRECLAKHETKYDSPSCPQFDPAEPAPLEGQLVDLADEIAYTSADIEDALGCGMMTAERLGATALWRRAWAEAQAVHPQARPVHKRIRAGKALLAAMADDLIAATTRTIQDMGIAGLADVRGAGGRIVAFSPAMREMIDEMQAFLLESVYLAGPNAHKDRQSRKVIGELFAAYVADPALLPRRYQVRIDADGLHRTVCDYIAGMTDRFCLTEHARIRGK